MRLFADFAHADDSTRPKERGFILIATMVMLMLLTIMAIGLFYRGRINQQSSYADRDATQGFYYAETGLNYLMWALNPTALNDVNFDTTGTGCGATTTDYAQLLYAATNGIDPSTCVKYFDNRTLADRTTYTKGGVLYPWPKNLTFLSPPLEAAFPPNFLKMRISSTQVVTITPVISARGGVLPSDGNGAALWVTAQALDPYTTKCSDINGTTAANTDCDGQITTAAGTPYTGYHLVFYSLGFVNGLPKRLLRRTSRWTVPPE